MDCTRWRNSLCRNSGLPIMKKQNKNTMPIKSLAIIFSQDENYDLVTSELLNQVGLITWVKNAAGIYFANSLGNFTVGKTYIPCFGGWESGGNPYIELRTESSVLGYLSVIPQDVPDFFAINVVNATGQFTDLFDIVGATKIHLPKIEVYP